MLQSKWGSNVFSLPFLYLSCPCFQSLCRWRVLIESIHSTLVSFWFVAEKHGWFWHLLVHAVVPRRFHALFVFFLSCSFSSMSIDRSFHKSLASFNSAPLLSLPVFFSLLQVPFLHALLFSNVPISAHAVKHCGTVYLHCLDKSNFGIQVPGVVPSTVDERDRWHCKGRQRQTSLPRWSSTNFCWKKRWIEW